MEPTTKQFWRFVYQHRYAKLLLPILGLIGGADIWKWVVTGNWPWLLVIVSLVAFIAVTVAWGKIRSTTLLDVNECKHFFPFLNGLNDKERARFYLPRPDTLKRLKEKMQHLRERHLIIVGESGSGKTTLIDVLRNDVPAMNLRFLPASDLDGRALINALAGEARLQNDQTLVELFEETVKSSNDAVATQGAADSLAHHLQDCVEKEVYLIIDQAERIKPQIDRSSDEVRRTTLAIIEGLRKVPNISIVFSVRSDKIDGIISLLGESGYDLFFLQGFDVFDRIGAREILKSKLRSISLPSKEIDKVLDELSESGNVNAFDFQLSGYVFECFGVNAVERIRHEKPFSKDFYFQIFHDGLYDEYGKLASDHHAASDLEILLFTIAYYNSRRSMPVSVSDATLLCHLPESQFQRALAYLDRRRVLDAQDRHAGYLRLSHDRVVEQVLTREPRFLQPDQQVAIEKVVDELPERLPKYHVLDYVSPFLNFARRDQSGRAEYGNPETILLWAFAVLYFVRIAYPVEFAAYLSVVNECLESVLPGVVFPAGESNVFFAPIAFTQYLWVLIIYGLNRGFFYYFWQDQNRTYMPLFLKSIGPLGALLGLLVSYAPALFIIPIAIPGLMLGIVYLINSTGRAEGAAIYRYMYGLGWATVGNMAIAFGVTYLLVDTMRHLTSENYFELATVNFLICMLFCYFAYQMRWRQGTNSGRCRMLAMYSAGRAV